MSELYVRPGVNTKHGVKKRTLGSTITKYLLIFLCFFIPLLGFWLYYNQVDTELNQEDKVYISKILGYDSHKPVKKAQDMVFEEQIATIRFIQDRILATAPINKEIPHNVDREPKDLFEHKQGLCYDRSRSIEKACQMFGFKVRHLSVFSTQQTKSGLKSLTTPGNPSHAISEVLTKKGWLVVDSNCRWISLDANNEPISLETMQEQANGGIKHKWDQPVCEDGLYMNRDTFVYLTGLYSRHGRFYRPFNLFPDINWGDFKYNILPEN